MNRNSGNLLVVDDEPVALKNLAHALEKEGYAVICCDSGVAAINQLDTGDFDVVLTDLKMKQVDGMQVLRHCKLKSPDTEVIVITGFATAETAVQAMQHGAFYYVAKPFRLEDVRKVVKEAMEKVRLKRQNQALKEQINTYKGKVRIVTQYGPMQQLLDTARQVATTDCNILISGESGTGKELLARYIHNHSQLTKGPFFAINCGAFNADLLSNELFGHERGAFTGATHQKKGLVEMASGGTLLLDEITEMPQSMQVKLLRVIQEQELLRMGGTTAITVDVRFIATTNRDAKQLVASGGLRHDLYYRLNVVSFELPPLRERSGDVLLLAQYFVNKNSALMDKPVTSLSAEAMAKLQQYDFPGNVRELENVVERGIALAHGSVIEAQHLPQQFKESKPPNFRKKDGRFLSLQEQETAYIQYLLDKTGGNKTATADLLGIDRVSLWRKLKKLGIDTK